MFWGSGGATGGPGGAGAPPNTTCGPPLAHPVLPRFVPAHIRHNIRNIQTDSGVPNLHDNWIWMVEVLTSAVAAVKCQPKRFNRCCRMLRTMASYDVRTRDHARAMES
jgi:hypothetical protein